MPDTAESLPITVVVPVKDEERNLPRCLAALGRFAHVLVVDSASTDRTVEIAREAGAEVLQFRWDGRYPKKRNWVLLNHRFETDWVLFLDADEVVDDRFCDALARRLRVDACEGYWLTYTNHFLGRRLNWGAPQRKLALFRVGAGLYERIEEERWSGLDMEIHEHPVIEGRVGRIDAPIEHNDDRGIEKFVRRHLDYASWEARRYRALADSEARRHWTWRQRFKYRSLRSWWYPWAYFFYTYFARLGLLDGAAGYQYAFYKFWYFQLIRQIIFQQDKAAQEEKRPVVALT